MTNGEGGVWDWSGAEERRRHWRASRQWHPANGEDGQLGGAVVALLQIFMSRVHYAGRTSSRVITWPPIATAGGGRRARIGDWDGKDEG